ncbi:hypothetical protein Rhopal_000860-T1 [Rhodotorula paludigena]|uniref:Uncharacterized protein n=1 Tax=Rhodotorula paludigena TaxID=86838 RepID=A0AAV5G681_9BASI|nr:hypothetical protein Rhopal_000860-T1 [Rhodotorula paludigena]
MPVATGDGIRAPMSALARTVFLLLASASTAKAHMELNSPYAIKSQFNKANVEPNIDWSMTSPLALDGSNWPAKGYATSATVDALEPVATLEAGKEFSWDLAGTATHNGGSCQVGVSYDYMETQVVIASWIGQCPLEKFNKTGNREMYQNAAVVAISGTATEFTGPQAFRINTYGKGVCYLEEETDTIFPNPGDQVFFADGYSADTPSNAPDCADWDNEKMVTVKGTGDGPASSGGGDDEGEGDEGKTKTKTGDDDGASATNSDGDPTATGGETGGSGAGAGATGTSAGGAGSSLSSKTSGTGAAGGGVASGTGGAVGGAASAGTGATGGAAAPTGESSASTGSTSGSTTDSEIDVKPIAIGVGVVALIVVAGLVIFLVARKKPRQRQYHEVSSESDDSDRHGGGRRRSRSSRRSGGRHSSRRRSSKSSSRRRKEETSETDTDSDTN